MRYIKLFLLFLLFTNTKVLAQSPEVIYEDFFIEKDTLYIIKRIIAAADSIYEVKIPYNELKSSGVDSLCINLNNYQPSRLLCVFERGGYFQGAYWNGYWYLSGYLNKADVVKKIGNGNETILFNHDVAFLQIIEENERAVGILFSFYGSTVIFENDTLIFPPLPRSMSIPKIIKKGKKIFVPTSAADFSNEWQELSILDLENKNLKTILSNRVPFATLTGICDYYDGIIMPLVKDSMIYIIYIKESILDLDTIAIISIPISIPKIVYFEADIIVESNKIVMLVGLGLKDNSVYYYLYRIDDSGSMVHYLNYESPLLRTRIRKSSDGKLFILAGHNLYIYDNNITKVETTEIENIKNFELYQNYPNPFNSTTTIKYKVPSSVNNINLKIYNILGQEIFKKVITSPGSYELKFDASHLPSGVYFCSLEVDGKIVKMIKMILIK
jgi:hypothetical protein